MGFSFQNRLGQNVDRRGPADQGGRRTSVGCGPRRRPGRMQSEFPARACIPPCGASGSSACRNPATKFFGFEKRTPCPSRKIGSRFEKG